MSNLPKWGKPSSNYTPKIERDDNASTTTAILVYSAFHPCESVLLSVLISGKVFGCACAPARVSDKVSSLKPEDAFSMRLLTRSFCAGFVFVLTAFLPAEGQSGSPAIAASSGKALCSALTPADFTGAGVPVAALSQANLDGTDGAYCVYRSKAGKVEFDIFFPAGANAREIEATEKTVLEEGGGKYQPVALAGADDARISLSRPDLPGSAVIVVRRGKAVFDIVIPAGAAAQKQLEGLARTVLGRLKP